MTYNTSILAITSFKWLKTQQFRGQQLLTNLNCKNIHHSFGVPIFLPRWACTVQKNLDPHQGNHKTQVPCPQHYPAISRQLKETGLVWKEDTPNSNRSSFSLSKYQISSKSKLSSKLSSFSLSKYHIASKYPLIIIIFSIQISSNRGCICFFCTPTKAHRSPAAPCGHQRLQGHQFWNLQLGGCLGACLHVASHGLWVEVAVEK